MSNNVIDVNFSKYFDCQESANQMIQMLKVSGSLKNPVLMDKVHNYMLRCCRRIWLLLPGEEIRKQIEAAESYCQGRGTFDDIHENNYEVESYIFGFNYRDATDPEIAEYVSNVREKKSTISRLLVPPVEEDNIDFKDLLGNAAWFASFAAHFRTVLFTDELESYAKFMPFDLYMDMVGLIPD